ncbi:MAG: TIGR01777 family oxidoreductase [Desulfarculaceae bacterium]|jgi:uncharacterized protein (TIGR01777 family)
MDIFITGGSGFVGQTLVPRLAHAGHSITILTRNTDTHPDHLAKGVGVCLGDPSQPGPWQKEAAQHQALINLAGASIFGRWTEEYKEKIRSSRLDTTRNLVKAIEDCQEVEKPVLISASAVGYYGFHGDEELDESAGPGADFLARLCQDWEAEALKARESGARVVCTRFGIILGPKGGALGQMLPQFKLGLGGRLGSGRQWLSWIHIEDLAEAILFCLEWRQSPAAVNFTAPHPVTNRELTRSLARVLRRPAFLPAPALAVRLVLGEFGSVLLKGQRVLPRALTQAGFSFRFPALDQALENLLTPDG